MKVPEKIKLFLWRASNNILHCYVNLASRKIPVSTICPRCGVKDETRIHALYDCPHAKQIWKMSPLGSVATVWKEKNFLDFFDHASWVLTREEMDLFGFLAWRIWHDRNLLVHENAKFDPQYSYLATVRRFEEYKNVVHSEGRGVKEKQKSWRPPTRYGFF